MKNNRIRLLALLLLPLSSPAEEGLSPPPDDANDYVRVWSETIGVESVLRADRAPQPGGSLDFYVTTTNVLDGFQALVRLEEINVDAWKLLQPSSGDAVPMRPGERIEYVVRDQTGIEPDKPGHVALYRVDVCIDGTPENEEETTGAIVLQKFPQAGFNDPGLTPFLVPVTIRCWTPDRTDRVDLELNNTSAAILLVRNASGALVEAEGHYSAEDLDHLDFFLLGERESQTQCDYFIRAKHASSQCQDIAHFTVQSSFQVYSVTYDQDVFLVHDPSLSPPQTPDIFEKPQYVFDPNAGFGLYSNRSHPVCYVRGSEIVVSSVIRHSNPFLSGPVHVRAESAAFSIPPTEVSESDVNGVRIQLRNAAPSRPLDNQIGFYDPLCVRWFVSVDGCQTWKDAGESTNRFYVVWNNPLMPTANYETAFFISCSAANGISGHSGTADDIPVFNAIWRVFHDLELHRAIDQRWLTYYGYSDINQNGRFDSHDETDYSSTMNHDYYSLVFAGNGNCESFVDLLVYCLLAQGLSSINLIPYERCIITSSGASIAFDPDSGVPTLSGNQPFAISNWLTRGTSQTYKVICPFAGVEGLDGSNLVLSDGQCKDALGVRGQGSSPNPPSRFISHVVFRWNGQLYDPSYGIGPFDDPKRYEQDILCGFFEDRIENGDTVSFLSTNLKPNDDDKHDETDLDLKYTTY